MIKMHIGHQVQGGSGDFVRVYSRDLGDWKQSRQYLQTALQVIGYRWVREDKHWPDRKSTLSDNILWVYERLHPILRIIEGGQWMKIVAHVDVHQLFALIMVCI